MISLDSSQIAEVNRTELLERREEQEKQLHVKEPPLEIRLKKSKGKGSALKRVKRKEALRTERRQKSIEAQKKAEQELLGKGKKKKRKEEVSVLDRFRSKDE